ncbi:MAG: Cys-tRNA(Pro) deacylase [Acidaminococcaceae bacterium]
MKIKKTNASRILDNMKIVYRLLEYEVDENNLDAVHVANSVGMPCSQVFKTLCVHGDKSGVIFACIPGDQELDLKALAKVSGNKRVELVALKDVLPITGYIRGGVSPLGAKKSYPVFLDVTANNWQEISISAGQRGLQIILAPEDLQIATNAKIAALNMHKNQKI